MADEQAQISPDTESVDETTSASPSDSSERGGSDASPSWWQRLMGRGHAEETEAAPGESAEASAEGKASTVTLPVEEFERRVQAETDRRAEKARLKADAEAKRKLRDENPWQYAEAERQEEQATQQNDQLNQFLSGIGSLHDGATIDPLVQSLPDAEKQRILGLEGAGVGLDGRKLIVSESLKALEKHWKAEGAREAEARLRKNPAFRKQLYSEFRGPEPEVLPVGPDNGRASSSQEINNFLRAQVNLPTGD